MAFVVIYDANVLYPSTLRDVLVRVAMTGLVQAKWTAEILDEVFRNIRTKRPELDPSKLERTRRLMTGAVRDCMVTDYDQLVDVLKLPDPDDRHVLAAAIRAKAQVIVTFNLSDFPEDALSAWDVEAKHPDDFLVDQFYLDQIKVHQAVQSVATPGRIHQAPPMTSSTVSRDRVCLR